MDWLNKLYPSFYLYRDQYDYKTRSEDVDDDPSSYYHDYQRTHEGYRLNLGSRFKLSDIIEIMTRDGKGRVVASPQIVTKNNNSAYLNASEMIPYSPDGYYWGGEWRARAGIYISVHPIIQKDDYVNLRISPRISDLTGWSPKGMPIIFERSLQTEVNVKNGETFVLGGLKKTEKINAVKGIPILKNIPVIKYLFSKTVKIDLNREVVMFITPTILDEKDLSEKMIEDLKKKIEK